MTSTTPDVATERAALRSKGHGHAAPMAVKKVRADDGIALAYRTVGTGPRHLLLLHGWGGNSTGFFWDQTIAMLDLTGVRLILADLRGHGASDAATTGFTSEQFGRDMFMIAEDAGATDVVLMAYSMSGRWAQLMAATQPERVVGQILIAPAPAADMPISDEVKADWLQVARTRTMATFEPWIHLFVHKPLSPEVMQAYFESVTTAPEHSLSETLDMCRSHGSFMDRLSAIRAPTLVIGGRYDPMLSPEVLRQAVVAPIPGARLALVDSGHEIPLEQPQALAGLIEAFLAGLR